MRAAGLMSTPKTADARDLQAQGEIAPAGLPQPVRQTIGLQGLEALEVEQRLQHSEAGRVAVGDRDDVGAKRFADRRIAIDRLRVGLADEGRRNVRIVQPRGDPEDDRALQRVMVQDGGHQEGRELGLAPDRLFGFLTDAREQRIVAGEPDDAGSRTLRHEKLLAPPSQALDIARRGDFVNRGRRRFRRRLGSASGRTEFGRMRHRARGAALG